MDVRRSITPRWCGKPTGNLGKFIRILGGFMRAAGIAGLLQSCNRYERRSWKRRAKIERFGNPRNCPKFGSFGSFGVLWPSLIATDVQKSIHGIQWLQAPDPPKPQAVNSYNDEQHRGQAFFNWFGFTTTGSSARTLQRTCVSWGNRTLVVYLGSLWFPHFFRYRHVTYVLACTLLYTTTSVNVAKKWD